MAFYLTYAQTPELNQLPTQRQRDAVHSLAWRRLRAAQPQLWHQSLAIVAACTLAGIAINHWFSLGIPFSWAGGIGAGAGALLHTHRMAANLRPHYAKILSMNPQSE